MRQAYLVPAEGARACDEERLARLGLHDLSGGVRRAVSGAGANAGQSAYLVMRMASPKMGMKSAPVCGIGGVALA